MGECKVYKIKQRVNICLAQQLNCLNWNESPEEVERTENEKVGAHGADAGEMRVQVAQ